MTLLCTGTYIPSWEYRTGVASRPLGTAQKRLSLCLNSSVWKFKIFDLSIPNTYAGSSKKLLLKNASIEMWIEGFLGVDTSKKCDAVDTLLSLQCTRYLHSIAEANPPSAASVALMFESKLLLSRCGSKNFVMKIRGLK